MSKLQQLHDETKNMLHRFEKIEDREQLIVDFEKFVEKREQLIKNIRPPFSEAEKEIGQKLVELDQQLKQYADKFLSKFKSEINELGKKRESNKKYVNPYADVYNQSGSFIDKKN